MSDFSDTQLEAICEAAGVIACECPAILVDLFRRVRQFRRYTQEECLVLVPEATETHHWLSDQLLPLEATLAQILTEFLQREHLLDEQQQVDLVKLAQLNRQAALRYQAAQSQSECNAPYAAAVPVAGSCAPAVEREPRDTSFEATQRWHDCLPWLVDNSGSSFLPMDRLASLSTKLFRVLTLVPLTTTVAPSLGGAPKRSSGRLVGQQFQTSICLNSASLPLRN